MKRDDWLVVGMRLFGVYFFVKGLLGGVSTLLTLVMAGTQTPEFMRGMSSAMEQAQNRAGALAIAQAVMTALVGAALFYGAPHILEWNPLERSTYATRIAARRSGESPTPEA